MEGDFERSVREDPLFAAAGMDLANARAALDELERALPAVEREYADTVWRRLFLLRYPLARYAFPVAFVRQFIRCEEARREYLDDPSPARAQELLRLWNDATRELTHALARYRTLQSILMRLERGRAFVMQDAYGFITSYQHADALIVQMEENARVLQREIAFRANLLKGAAWSSAVRARQIPDYRPARTTSAQERLHEATITGGTWPYRYGEILEERGPFVFTLPHFDGEAQEHVFKWYMLRDARTGLSSMWIALVDRFLFLDIWNLIPAADALVRGAYATSVGLERDEMPYWHEPSTTLYSSRDATYWMDIATMIDSIRRTELDARLIGAQRSSMFDKILVECARDTRSMVAHLRRRKRADVKKRYSLAYDFLTRTHPSVFFLPFNRSVWRLPDRPQFLGERHEAIDPKKRLSEAQQEELLTDDVLQTVMVASKLREERGRAQGWLD